MIELPPDNQPMFDMGDSTKLAEPYWKLNQIIVTKSIETSHSSNEVINDFFLIDKD